MTTTRSPRTTGTDHGRAARTSALVVGIVFLVVGVAGFVPGITTDYDLMELAGHESEAMLLGVFQVSVLHNAVHLLFGVIGVVLARRVDTARAFLIGGGIIYLALLVYGVAVDPTSDANFVPLNDADNWLHLFLGVGMIALGALTWDRVMPPARTGGR